MTVVVLSLPGAALMINTQFNGSSCLLALEQPLRHLL